MTETAVANGDTRTINLFHSHTQESISATYLVNGQYDRNVLQQLNWFLRDWRRDEPTEMDPRLFDVIWEAYRSAGASGEYVRVVSAYRSPETNAMLRARSRAVAKFSQHMLGKAMDTTMPGMPMSRIREIGMRMQRGGVGYYPTAGTPFVHLDVGNVRAWPRMTYDQLVRLFPDGKTVHIASNGQMLARYDEAKAEIEARNNGAIVVAPQRSGFGGFLASLFGGGGEDDVEEALPAPDTRRQWADLAPRMSRAARRAKIESDEEEAPAPSAERGRQAIARAEADLPRGETVMRAEPAANVSTTDEPQRPAPAEREKAAFVNAPQPPAGRPSSIDKPTPLEEPRVAALEPAPESRAPQGRSSEREAASVDKPVSIDAPAPPRRPLDLGKSAQVSAQVAALVDAPLPPRRPKAPALATAPISAPQPAPRPRHLSAQEAGEAASALANAVETTGSIKPAATDSAPEVGVVKDAAPLAFAAPPAKTSARAKRESTRPAQEEKAGLVPARLDRSNFTVLTGSAPASAAVEASVAGASVGAVRPIARAREAGVLATPTGAAARGFDGAGATPAATGFVKD